MASDSRTHTPTPPRVVIVFDGERWFARHLRTSMHDWATDEMVYQCDAPLGIPRATLADIAREIANLVPSAAVPAADGLVEALRLTDQLLSDMLFSGMLKYRMSETESIRYRAVRDRVRRALEAAGITEVGK